MFYVLPLFVSFNEYYPTRKIGGKIYRGRTIARKIHVASLHTKQTKILHVREWKKNAFNVPKNGREVGRDGTEIALKILLSRTDTM